MAAADPTDRQAEAAQPVAAVTAVPRPAGIRPHRPAATARLAGNLPVATAVRPVTVRPAHNLLVATVLRVTANRSTARLRPADNRRPARAR
jgi:hypothetical protein